MHRPSPVQRSWSIHTRTTVTLPPIPPDGPFGRAVTLVTVPDAHAAPTAETVAADAAPVPPPVAKRVDHAWDRPTGPVDDPWAWLRDRDDPDTVAYLEAENAYTETWFAPHPDLTETLFQEIKSRIQETDVAVPVAKDGWWYTARTTEGLNYPTHCRGRSRETATEQVLLDENAEAEGHDYFSRGAFDVSPDHHWVAWSSDTDGSEEFTVRFRDLDTGVDADDRLEGTSSWGGTAWSADATTFFYTMPDDQMRPYQIWRHRLGTPQSDDVLVLEEPDERFYLAVELTRSGEWIVMESASKLTSTAWVLPAGDPTAQPVEVRPRTEGLECAIDHWGDRFVVLTNLDAEDFRVMTAPLDDPGSWSELVPHVPGQRITAAEPFAGHLVVHEWSDAQQRIRILRDDTWTVLDLGDEPHELELDANPEWHTGTLRYSYQSFTTPA